MQKKLYLLFLSLLCMLFLIGAEAATTPETEDCESKTEVLCIPLPYATVYKCDDMLPWGTERTVQQGADGCVTEYFSLAYEEDRLISRSLLSYERKEPVAEIIHYGTQSKNCVVKVIDYTGGTLERNGKVLPYRCCLRLNATAYTKGEELVDDTTAMGTQVHRGIVAVDRRVIPLGSKVYVETTDGVPSYGFASAEDTGVLGNSIDLYMDDVQSCLSFGRRDVNVYILA